MGSLADLHGLEARGYVYPKEMRRVPGQRKIVVALFRIAKKLKGSEAGVTLIETLVALAVLASIAVVFLSGLATAARATLIVDERATAESIARSAVEDVKNQSYIDYGEHETITAQDAYSIELTATPIDPDTGLPLAAGEDLGIQKITVAVSHGDKSVLTVEDYKVNR